MFSILRAELRRSIYHSNILIFVGVTLLISIFALSLQVSEVLQNTETTELILEFEKAFSFPNSLVNSLDRSQILFLFVIPAAVGYYIGQDYQLNTWKMILPRTPQRGILLLGKSLNVIILLTSLFLIIFGGYLICGVVGALWLDTSIIGDSVFHLTLENQLIVLESIAFIFWYLSVSILITIVSRSVIMAASFSLAFYFFCVLIQIYSPEIISVWFAPTHFSNLITVPTKPGITDFRPSVAPIVSWMVVIVHIIANLLISYIVLMRQEFSGD